MIGSLDFIDCEINSVQNINLFSEVFREESKFAFKDLQENPIASFQLRYLRSRNPLASFRF